MKRSAPGSAVADLAPAADVCPSVCVCWRRGVGGVRGSGRGIGKEHRCEWVAEFVASGVLCEGGELGSCAVRAEVDDSVLTYLLACMLQGYLRMTICMRNNGSPCSRLGPHPWIGEAKEQSPNAAPHRTSRVTNQSSHIPPPRGSYTPWGTCTRPGHFESAGKHPHPPTPTHSTQTQSPS